MQYVLAKLVPQSSFAKLSQILRFKLTRVLVFRTEMLIWIVLSFLPFAILFLIWQELFSGRDQIQGYTLADITTYYLVASLLANLTEVHFEGWRSEEIRLGRIDHFLTKPYHYISDILYGETVGKLLYTAFFILPYAAFIWWAQSTVGVGTTAITLLHVLQFLLLMVIAYSIQFCFGLLITLLTFWFEGSSGLEHFKWIVITLLSGTLMPLDFLPSWLRQITELLPFKYLYAVPINVLQGRHILNSADLVQLSLTLVILIVSVRWVWHKGVAKYCSAGG